MQVWIYNGFVTYYIYYIYYIYIVRCSSLFMVQEALSLGEERATQEEERSQLLVI